VCDGSEKEMIGMRCWKIHPLEFALSADGFATEVRYERCNRPRDRRRIQRLSDVPQGLSATDLYPLPLSETAYARSGLGHAGDDPFQSKVLLVLQSCLPLFAFYTTGLAGSPIDRQIAEQNDFARLHSVEL